MEELRGNEMELLKWIKEKSYLLDREYPISGINDDPRLFNDLDDYEKVNLVNWILTTMLKRKAINKSITSYQLKHYFERSPLGVYVGNGQMKGALLVAGFKTKDEKDTNSHFDIAENSLKNMEGIDRENRN